MNQKFISVINRFAKGIIAGAVSAMSMVAITQPEIWKDFNGILESLAMAATFGAITGLLLALQKWSSWVDEE